MNVTVNIARTEEEAKLQLARGSAFTTVDEMEAEDVAAAAEAAEAALAIADDAEAEVAAAEGLVEEEVVERLASDAAAEENSENLESSPAES